MKKGWELVTLKDVCTKGSSNITQRSIRDNEGQYSIYGASGLIKKVDFYQQEKPYIGIIKDGSGYGRIMKLEAKSSVIGTLQYLIPNEDIDINYFYYFLLGIDFRKYVQGAAIPHIYFKDYKDESFLKLPLPEQKQIVAILDKAFEAIDQAQANIEKNIENAKELFQSKLNDIFSQKGEGWEKKKFKDVCVLQRGFDLPKRLRKQGEHPLVSSSGVIDTHVEAKVKAPGVVTGRSGSIGNLFFIENDFWPLNTTLYIKDFKYNYEEYIYYLIKQFDLKRFSSGAGVPTLNRNFVHDEIVLSTNDIEVQKQIVKQLNDLKSGVEAIESHYHQKLTNLEDLKKSILQKAFNGQLTVNNGELIMDNE